VATEVTDIERIAMLAQIVLFDGFDLLDVVAPYEVLWAGGVAAGGALRVELVSLEGARDVPSGPSGVTLPATAALDPGRADLIIVPGAAGPVSGDGPDTIPALLGRAAGSGLPAVIQRALDTPGKTVATVCGGSLVLAMAGLLTGRRAVTHHMGMDVLAATGASAVAARVVDDGNLVSAGGVTSGLDLAVYLLERELGPRVAHAVEALFAYERRGTVWRAHGPEPVAP
jgi:transcriptional regulator GlxA family with amidase domain